MLVVPSWSLRAQFGRPGYCLLSLLGHSPATLQGNSTGGLLVNRVAVAWRKSGVTKSGRCGGVLNKAGLPSKAGTL